MRIDLDDLVRPARAPRVTVDDVRPIVQEDLSVLQEARGSEAPPLKRLRYKHHSLARALADGLSETEAGLVAGYDSNYVSILKQDPAFRDLVAFYRGEHAQAYDAVHATVAGLSLKAAEELDRRLEEEPHKLGAAFLKDLMVVGLDRTGHGPTQTQVQRVELNFAQRLEEARKRAQFTLPAAYGRGGLPHAPDTVDADFEVLGDD